MLCLSVTILSSALIQVDRNEPDYDPWHKEVGKDIKEPYRKQVQRFMDREVRTKLMQGMLLSIPCYLKVEEGYAEFTYSI